MTDWCEVHHAFLATIFDEEGRCEQWHTDEQECVFDE
jgi:hypothetical protein